MTSDVNIISISTHPQDDKSPEELVTYCARVSNPANQNNKKTAKGLLKYLIREGHWSPFEMVSVTMEITTTRDIARQILRHRSFSFQEFSQRYADPMSESLGFSMREARLQDTKNRQNSIEVDESEVDLHAKWRQLQHVVRLGAESAYKQAIELGIAKEQARALLPEGLTNSRVYMAGTLRSWIHFCSLRIANGTQKEHSVLAAAAWQLLKTEFPNVTDAVEEIGMIEDGGV
tara:strand:- start:8022 stop:8717 length:696 start_codon:yes stop_codon:yes gene_type:complete